MICWCFLYRYYCWSDMWIASSFILYSLSLIRFCLPVCLTILYMTMFCLGECGNLGQCCVNGCCTAPEQALCPWLLVLEPGGDKERVDMLYQNVTWESSMASYTRTATLLWIFSCGFFVQSLHLTNQIPSSALNMLWARLLLSLCCTWHLILKPCGLK